MRHLDLFSGIGGGALAVEAVWPDSEHIFCEIDPYCKALLHKRFPNSKIYGDIRTLRFDTNPDSDGRTDGKEEVNPTEGGEQTFNDLKGRIDILTGGFPCQPFSQAGRRKGTSDNRFLWPEMLRVIREFKPRWIVGENVAGLLSIEQGVVFKQIIADLEAEDYEIENFVIPAVAVNAPHRRDRVWIIGHAKYDGLNATENRKSNQEGIRSNTEGTNELRKPQGTDSVRQDVADSECEELQGFRRTERNEAEQSPRWSLRDVGFGWDKNWIEIATELCGVDYGLPAELDGLKLSKSRHRAERLGGLGNAWVPQAAIEIMKGIKYVEDAP